jgi:uncharacterized protein
MMQNMPHKSWWHELYTWEPETALAFYSRTMGWDFEPVAVSDDGGYWLARKDGRPVGGIFEMTAPDYDGTPSHWMTYLEVANIEETGLAARHAGGGMARDPVTIPGLGAIAVVQDAQGVLIGLFQPESPDLGVTLSAAA